MLRHRMVVVPYDDTMLASPKRTFAVARDLMGLGRQWVAAVIPKAGG